MLVVARGGRYGGLALVLVAASSCGGDATGQAGPGLVACLGGATTCGTPDGGAGSAGDSGLDGSPDASSEAEAPAPAVLPPPLSDACFTMPAPGADLETPTPSATTPWTVRSAAVARGGDGFALWLTRTTDGMARAVYLDRRGGCARPISPEVEGGPNYAFHQGAAGGSTIAAVVTCGHRGFACGATLYANGAAGVSSDELLGHGDLMSRWTFDVAIAPDGAPFVAAGPRTAESVSMPMTNGPTDEPSFADTLVEAWLAPGGADAMKTTTHATSVLTTLAAVEFDSARGVALALRDVTDGGLGGSRVGLQSVDFATLSTWVAPPGMTITSLAARGGALAVAGEKTDADGVHSWVTVLSLPGLTPRWAPRVLSPEVGLPFGVGLTSDGSLVIGTATAAGGLELHAFDAAGTGPTPRGAYAALDGEAVERSTATLQVTGDDTVLVAAGPRVAALTP